jgi:hypothetical protein
MFTLNPLYNKFPRFKRRYHVSILIKRLKNQIIPVRAPSRTPRCAPLSYAAAYSHSVDGVLAPQHTVAFILVKLRLRNALSAKNKVHVIDIAAF